MDSLVISELINNGGIVSYEKNKYWKIIKDNIMISIDENANLEFIRELNSDNDNWTKQEYIELSPEENYFLQTTTSSVHSLKYGTMYNSIITKKRSDFIFYRSNNSLKKKKPLLFNKLASNIITTLNDNYVLIDNSYKAFNCKILSISGQEILNIKNCNNVININTLIPGAYIIQISGNFGMYTNKFFKLF